jgi:hypothetical protein
MGGRRILNRAMAPELEALISALSALAAFRDTDRLDRPGRPARHGHVYLARPKVSK